MTVGNAGQLPAASAAWRQFSPHRETAKQLIRLTGDPESGIMVERMQEYDNAEMLSAHMRRRVLPTDSAAGLAAALDFIPLAVIQVTAYIRIHGCRGVTYT
jgi:DUF1365 family protein